MIVLGLTGGFHAGACDAAAVLMKNGVVLAAVEEERLTRIKHSFGRPPSRSISCCLDMAGLSMSDVDCVAYYVNSYPEALEELSAHLRLRFGAVPTIHPVEHHLCHAASAYYASGLPRSTVVVFDWSGDGVSTSAWKGEGAQLEAVERIARPNSLGIFYAAFTQLMGFDRGDEYKVMGLAAYGTPRFDLSSFLDTSGEVYELNPDIFAASTRSMHQTVFGRALEAQFPELQRVYSAPITQDHMDLAASVQAAFEEAVLRYARHAITLTGERNLCIAGGCGLNCRCNGRLVQEKAAEEIYLPPFPNDSGCAFGAAAHVTVQHGLNVAPLTTSQLGPAFDDAVICTELELLKCPARRVNDIESFVAQALARGRLVAWYQGRLEIGPRALGGRSILADPRDPAMKDHINRHIKFRESFRPFAPSVLEDRAVEYFGFEHRSPFMSFTADVRIPDALPAVTHVDGSTRLQTVPRDDSPYARLLEAVEAESGYGAVLNTSFNIMGQPVVCTPREAIYTFFGTGLDLLVMDHWVVSKTP